MTPEQLAAIEARDRARTAGEWTARTQRCAEPVGKRVSCISRVTLGYYGNPSAATDFLELPAMDSEADYPVGPNAAFIAACSVDVPALCAALRAAWAEVERLRARNAILEDRLEEWSR